MTTDIQGLINAAAVAQQHTHGGAGTLPGHPLFGAMFVVVGALLVVELLAGPVWHHHRILNLCWPTALSFAGIGMVLVTMVQPTEKSLHLTLAVLLLIGSYFEFQYRQGFISRRGADAFGIPALIVGGFVVGPMHSNGPLLESTMAQAHMLVGVICWVLAGVRLALARAGVSATAPLPLRVGLDYSFGIGVVALGISLLLVQQSHGA